MNRSHLNRFATLGGGLAYLVLLASNAAAQQKLKWDHAECKATMDMAAPACNPVFNLSADDGEKISLTIVNTCDDRFEYTVVSIPVPPSVGRLEGEQKCTGTKTIDITHEAKYGGYLINVVRKENTAPPAGNARLTIAVRTSQWILGFAGGFTVNGLVDPVFALREETTTANGATTTKYKIVEENDREDEYGHSVVSFIHLSHTGWKFSNRVNVGLSFGVGVESEKASDYYPGLSFLYGDKAALTIGYAFGQVKTLPAGRELNDLVTDANALATLGHRRIGRLFAGLSYSFLSNSGDQLKKPFLGQNPPGGTPVTSADTPSTSAKSKVSVAKDVATDSQTVKPGASSKPLKLKATNAPDSPVTWILVPDVPGADFDPKDDKTDASGAASATLKLPANAKEGTVQVKAKVCSAKSPDQCADAAYTITIKS